MENVVNDGQHRFVPLVKTKAMLFDVLPLQSHYWLLDDGKAYVCHQVSLRTFGVVVFSLRENAEQFCMTFAKKIRPRIKPVRVSGDNILEIIRKANGKWCIWDGTKVIVVDIRENPGEMESVAVV